MRVFNAFQIVVSFVAAPWVIVWANESRHIPSALSWAPWALYVAFSIFMTVALVTALSVWDKQ